MDDCTIETAGEQSPSAPIPTPGRPGIFTLPRSVVANTAAPGHGGGHDGPPSSSSSPSSPPSPSSGGLGCGGGNNNRRAPGRGSFLLRVRSSVSATTAVLVVAACALLLTAVLLTDDGIGLGGSGVGSGGSKRVENIPRVGEKNSQEEEDGVPSSSWSWSDRNLRPSSGGGARPTSTTTRLLNNKKKNRGHGDRDRGHGGEGEDKNRKKRAEERPDPHQSYQPHAHDDENGEEEEEEEQLQADSATASDPELIMEQAEEEEEGEGEEEGEEGQDAPKDPSDFPKEDDPNEPDDDGSSSSSGQAGPNPPSIPPNETPNSDPPLLVNTYVESTSQQDQTFALQELSERLSHCQSSTLNFDPGATRQFAHLHHMKTGGTSVNRLIGCALDRARRMHEEEERAAAEAAEAKEAGGEAEAKNAEAKAITTPIHQNRRSLPFTSLEECSASRYASCIAGLTSNTTSGQSCRTSIDSAAVMQYCAPLHIVEQFSWLDADLVSVIRHPVDRVWSMFRFQTKGCFKCMPLVDIYERIDNGTVDELGLRTNCVSQLLNHQTTNLLTDEWDGVDVGWDGVAGSKIGQAKVEEAVRNLQTRLALVGVTDELAVFAEMLGRVFPWLAREIVVEVDGEGRDGADTGVEEEAPQSAAEASSLGAASSVKCELPHANASPKNNRCGPGSTHWDLPDVPDEGTARAILRHNRLDLRVYEAAKERFEMERHVLGL